MRRHGIPESEAAGRSWPQDLSGALREVRRQRTDNRDRQLIRRYRCRTALPPPHPFNCLTIHLHRSGAFESFVGQESAGLGCVRQARSARSSSSLRSQGMSPPPPSLTASPRRPQLRGRKTMESKNGGLYDSGIDAPDADRALRSCRKDHEPASGLSRNLAGLRECTRDAAKHSARPGKARRRPVTADACAAYSSSVPSPVRRG
jgi:hypothetical protein